MADYIPTPTMSEILKEEFMEPMNLSAYRLAKEIQGALLCPFRLSTNWRTPDERRICPDTWHLLKYYSGKRFSRASTRRR